MKAVSNCKKEYSNKRLFRTTKLVDMLEMLSIGKRNSTFPILITIGIWLNPANRYLLCRMTAIVRFTAVKNAAK